MSGLFNLQTKFQNYLLKDNAEIFDMIVSSEKIPAATRLGIYQNAYNVRLIDSLANNYPCLKAYLGFEQFQEIGQAYLQAYPSPYRSIRWFGDKLADFLMHHFHQDYIYLSELAQFEWKMTTSFDASDMVVLTIEEIASIPPAQWADMSFIPHASLNRMNFSWNTVDIWQALANETRAPEAIKNNTSSSWILWRNQYLNRFNRLNQDEAWAIDALLGGSTFGEICTGLGEWHEEEEIGMIAASLLKKWTQAGLLSEIIIENI